MYFKIALSIYIAVVPTFAQPANAYYPRPPTTNGTASDPVLIIIQSEEYSWQNILFGVLSIVIALGSLIVATLHYLKQRRNDQEQTLSGIQEMEMVSAYRLIRGRSSESMSLDRCVLSSRPGREDTINPLSQ